MGKKEVTELYRERFDGLDAVVDARKRSVVADGH
jgi:hypothetical protein